MMTIIRHILTAFLFSLLLVITVLGITFMKFPINEWERLLTENVFNVPYLGLIAIFILLFSIIIGMTTSQYWKQRTNYIERQLDQLNNTQSLLTEEEKFKELQLIDTQLKKLEEKIRYQIEHSQRLASERALEREQSLQEVVIQERNRLARDLHDSVSQQLFAASMMMSAINENTDEQEVDIVTLKHQLNMVENMIQQSQLEMRALLLHLRPAALKGKALHEGINDLIEELQERIPLDMKTKIEEFPIEKGVEDQLFRILQEAVSNTLRHAKATTLEIMLIQRDQMIILRVVDDGVGFEMTETSSTSSYGLGNMQERAIDLGGTMKIVSLPNKGTRLEVKVPYIEREVENDD